MPDLDHEPAVLLDLDGTLVDSVYAHVVAWDESFRANGRHVPLWRIHAGVGMGSSRLLPWLLGEVLEDTEPFTSVHTERFLARADELRPTPGARELLQDLEARAVRFLIATSANPEEREALLRALGREDLPTTDAGDVDEPKPSPALLLEACRQLGAEPDEATMVGDSPWDAEAAEQVGIRSIAVRTGGFGDDALTRAGAIDVVDDPRALLGRL